MNNQKSVTISGSFQKFAREVKSVRAGFIDLEPNARKTLEVFVGEKSII